MKQWSIDGPDQDWFTKEEVAMYLDTSARSVDRMIAAGEFPRGTRIGPGSRLWWSAVDIAVYLYMRKHCREGPADVDPREESENPPVTSR